jgi:hypothetical protein
MTKLILIITIIVLIILIIIFTIATLWLQTDFKNCEESQNPYCPYFTCSSTGNNDPEGNNGEGYPAIRVDSNNKIITVDGKIYISS